MVSLKDYATVSQDADLFDAVQALKEAQKNFSQNQYRHRAVLVFDENKKIVGKLGMHDLVKGLEPRYKEINLEKFASLGYGSKFIRSALDEYNLWQKPLDDICMKASKIRVKNIMSTLTKGEFVDEDANLEQAMHLFVIGHHQSLLVTRKSEIVGILRLTDVVNEICRAIEACRIDRSL
jgi:CBS domain-containing protein